MLEPDHVEASEPACGRARGGDGTEKSVLVMVNDD